MDADVVELELDLEQQLQLDVDICDSGRPRPERDSSAPFCKAQPFRTEGARIRPCS